MFKYRLGLAAVVVAGLAACTSPAPAPTTSPSAAASASASASAKSAQPCATTADASNSAECEDRATATFRQAWAKNIMFFEGNCDVTTADRNLALSATTAYKLHPCVNGAVYGTLHNGALGFDDASKPLVDVVYNPKDHPDVSPIKHMVVAVTSGDDGKGFNTLKVFAGEQIYLYQIYVKELSGGWRLLRDGERLGMAADHDLVVFYANLRKYVPRTEPTLPLGFGWLGVQKFPAQLTPSKDELKAAATSPPK